MSAGKLDWAVMRAITRDHKYFEAPSDTAARVCRSDLQVVSAKKAPRVILVLAMDPVRPMEMFALLEVFHEANRICGNPQTYDVRLLSASRDRYLKTSTGTMLQADGCYAECSGAVDTLLLSGSDASSAPAYEEPLLEWLRLRAKASRRVGALHTGALALARAGLLNGRKATTHWKWCDQFRSLYPAVSVERNVIYVRDENFYTAAGATAGIDLALALVEEDLGTTVASTIAQTMLVFAKRSGGQPQISATLAAQSSESKPLAELLSWLPDNLQGDLSVAKLARRSAMSARNFARAFRACLGTTPAKYIENLRVESAKYQLEATTQSLAGVASACGFANSERLRRVFLRKSGLTPAQYRNSVKPENTPARVISDRLFGQDRIPLPNPSFHVASPGRA